MHSTRISRQKPPGYEASQTWTLKSIVVFFDPRESDA